MSELTCPACGESRNERIVGCEYDYNSPERYDGVSEWRCRTCDTRWGRWTGKVLKAGELEKRYGGA